MHTVPIVAFDCKDGIGCGTDVGNGAFHASWLMNVGFTNTGIELVHVFCIALQHVGLHELAVVRCFALLG